MKIANWLERYAVVRTALFTFIQRRRRNAKQLLHYHPFIFGKL